jgi:hypothetical protein
VTDSSDGSSLDDLKEKDFLLLFDLHWKSMKLVIAFHADPEENGFCEDVADDDWILE